MKVKKFKKLTKGRYKITFDTDDEYNIYEEVIFKYELLLNKDIDMKKLDELLKENDYYEAYNLALSYIEYRLRSRKEIINYLKNKDFEESLIDKVLINLEKYGYLNDCLYTKSFISDKLLLSYDGPYKIKKQLIDNGVDEAIINEQLSIIDDNLFREKVRKQINKRYKSNKKPMSIFVSKTIEYLMNLGYDKEMILEELHSLNNDEDKEEELLKKDYEKLYKKYSKKYSDNKLLYEIKSALYRKGYSSEVINKIME